MHGGPHPMASTRRGRLTAAAMCTVVVLQVMAPVSAAESVSPDEGVVLALVADEVAGTRLRQPAGAATSGPAGLVMVDEAGGRVAVPRSAAGRMEFRDPNGGLTLGITLPTTVAAGEGSDAGAGRIAYRGTSSASALAQIVDSDDGAAGSIAVVLDDDSAPESFAFALEVRPGIELHLDPGSGAVEVRDWIGLADGDDPAIAVIDAPWAYDADGREIPTSFSLDGGTLTLHVAHRGASYPVVADPDVTTNCGISTCSIYWSRSRTQAINSWTWLGPGFALANAGCSYAPGGSDQTACYVVAFGSYAGYVSPITQATLGYILSDAATNWRCFRISRSRGTGAPTYVSTNNGSYCTSY